MTRYLPPIVFLVVAAIGVGMTTVVYRAEETADRVRFERLADDAVERVLGRVRQHVALLISTHAFFSAQAGQMSRSAFQTFVAALDLEGQFEGIRGIGYARLIPTGKEQAAEEDLARNYGLQREVWPKTNQVLRTPIVLLEPSDERNRVALGYDMFNESRRRAAMTAAIDSGEMRASAPVELVQEITETKQAGFLVYIPFSAPRDDGAAALSGPPGIDGFVYAPFRAGDLHQAALAREPSFPVEIETVDTSDGSDALLFRTAGFDPAQFAKGHSVERRIETAGRQWAFRIHPSTAFSALKKNFYSLLTGAISFLLALALAMSSRFQLKAVEAAEKLRAVSEKTVQEKDLMLQEMKHRIKNSIARVLAIARQTAANSDTIEDFSQSFTARLNSMANAQDMLTRSHWQRADLRELLNTELEQVFGDSCSEEKITGPKVLLDERTTQALGLTFHELATNALKYGGISTNNGDLLVNWEVQRVGKGRRLQLDWIETSAHPVEEPERSGFGTRLIDANIRGELGGSIDRDFRPGGMSVRMNIPL